MGPSRFTSAMSEHEDDERRAAPEAERPRFLRELGVE